MLLSLCITCHCHFHTPGIGTCSFLNLECLNFQFVFSSSSLLEKRLKASVSCFQTMLILILLDNLPSSNVNSRIYILKSPFLHLNQMSLSLEFCRISYDCFHRTKIETLILHFYSELAIPKGIFTQNKKIEIFSDCFEHITFHMSFIYQTDYPNPKCEKQLYLSTRAAITKYYKLGG